MSLTPGTRLGPYEVLSAIGAGGMGEVYKARDTRLDRTVAIKILPEAFAADADRVARFQREAKTLAALNHPNIAQIFGLEQAGDVHALAMEFVAGEDLSERIARGLIPMDEALPIAKQIAEALEAAHEQGIIHRDLKPANIKVRADGTVKVLDFGLAKAIDPVGTPANASLSPTITSPAMTQQGMILGTAAYMSPEQARGRPADARSDLWAFGCVLYEMLTGRRAFMALNGSHSDPGSGEEESIADVLAAVLSRTPDLSVLPGATPAGVRRLLQRCLDRDRRHRLQTAADVRLRLEDAFAEPHEVPVAASSPAKSRGWIAAFALLAVALVLSVPAVKYVREVPPVLPETRTEIATPPTTDLGSFALSPDGRQLVFAAENNGHSQLWLRALASSVAQPLTGTEGGVNPFWSPDGASLGFFAGSKLRVLDLASGGTRTLSDVLGARGGAWNAEGVVLFAPSTASPLFRTTPAGATPTPATRLDQQQSHSKPQFLPDGRHFIFFSVGNPDHAGVYMGTLDSNVATRLTPADAAGVFLPAGWLVWPRDSTVWAQQVDVSKGALGGSPVALSGSIAFDTSGGSAISASLTGLLALRAGAANRRQLKWFDRRGQSLGTLGDPDESNLIGPRISPDGRSIAVHRTVNGNTDVWFHDGAHMTRITTDPALDRFPVWSPDGRAVVFDSNRNSIRQLYRRNIGITAVDQLLLASPRNTVPQSWSADGRFLLYAEVGGAADGNFDLWALHVSGEPNPFPVLKTAFTEKGGDFSPDGRWIAYMSDESGRPEIYVRRFIVPGSLEGVDEREREWPVSTAGGIYPKWARDGSEIFYLAPDGTVMAVPVRVTAMSFEPGKPISLFRTRVFGGGSDNQQGLQYDVTRDGRFLINTVLDDTTPITLIQNWSPPRTP